MTRNNIALILFILLFSGCSNQSAGYPTNDTLKTRVVHTQTIKSIDTNHTPTPTNLSFNKATSTPTRQSAIKTTATIRSTASQPTPIPKSSDWKKKPVIPDISPHVIEIYQRGQKLGNNLHAFSKIGDCGSTPSWFLGDFDRGARFYNLGDYQYLEDIIEYYAGSFDRTSLAALSGFNASSVLTPLWANRSLCDPNETPLACEYRLHRPILAFITLGANDVFHLETFESQMRKIIDYSIDKGIVPILSTKPDNVEKDHQINTTLSRLASEYKIPLWNYWLAVQPLPNHGLQEDGVHITWGSNHFDDPKTMQTGWAVRNLTALQVLDAFYQAVTPTNTP